MFAGIILLLITGAGLLSLFKPDVVWMISESWKSSADAEPSDSYLVITRISGAIVTEVGVVTLIMMLGGAG